MSVHESRKVRNAERQRDKAMKKMVRASHRFKLAIEEYEEAINALYRARSRSRTRGEGRR